MPVQRLIFHCDCNNFFASCECLDKPELKNVPMAVAGNPEDRVGVVVAKNDLAKKFGVKTTDTVWQAKKKCPGIVFVPPRHHVYKQISDRVNAVYRDYSDYVEPASIDESYLDLTGTLDYYRMTSRELADEIRRRVREEIGVTISVGVSFNKVFAKMGSDYKKPDATTVITPDNYREIIWPLPVSDLLFAGKASVKVLNDRGIRTIGDLALQPRERIGSLLGKGGGMLWAYANGLDDEPVRLWGDLPEVKSVSHGMTFRRDLTSRDEVATGVSALADQVATGLRRHGLKGSVITVQIKSPALQVISRQASLPRSTWIRREIQDVAMQLIESNWRIGPSSPIRAITVGVSRLSSAAEETEQMDMMDLLDDSGVSGRKRQDRVETTVDAIRRKLGADAVTLGSRQKDQNGILRR